MKKYVSIFIDGKKYQIKLSSSIIWIFRKLNLFIPILFIGVFLSFIALNVLNSFVKYKGEKLLIIKQEFSQLAKKSNNLFNSIETSRQITKNNSNLLNVTAFGLGDYGIGGGALSDNITKIEHLNIKLGVYSNLTDNIIHSRELNNSRKLSIINDLSNRPSIKPAEGYLASGFGYRMHPILHVIKFHKGLDIAGPIGTPIKSTANGVVVNSRYSKSYGNIVKILHKTNSENYYTVYAHMDVRYARVGTKVKKGEMIGRIGNTGRTTGPHLHYEVIKNGNWVNPIQYFYPNKNIID